MSLYVVDASVAAKWFFDEPFAEEAARLLNASHTLHVPDCFVLEVDSILCKTMWRGEISEDEAQEVRSALEIFPMQKHPFYLLRDAAFQLALQTRTSPL